MPKKIYEIVTAHDPLKLRRVPRTGDDSNIIQSFQSGILVERLGKETFPDENLGSGVTFIRVKVSEDPDVEGFMALKQIDTETGLIIEYFLLRTPSARAAQKTLH